MTWKNKNKNANVFISAPCGNSKFENALQISGTILNMKMHEIQLYQSICGHKLAYSTFQAFVLSLKGYRELSLTQIDMQGQSALMQL